ncbi:YkvA family protein [Thermodesulfobacteriota bacterium]
MKKHEGYYKKLRSNILSYKNNEGKDKLWLKYLMLAPDFFYLLYHLVSDDRIDADSKIKLSAALTYFINPFDFIPDFLISVGFLDDIVVAAYVLSSVFKYVSPDIANEYWPAKRNIVEVVDDVNCAAEKILAGDVINRITSLFGEKP